MDLEDLIEQLASQADDFLDGFNSRTDARAGIFEMLVIQQFPLDPPQRKQVADGVMAILETEGFFNATPGADSTKAAEE